MHTIREDGRVLIENGSARGLVNPHDTFTLDALLPDLTAQERQDILDAWDAFPVPQPPPSPAATAYDVKYEANRRILSKYPGWKQRNMIARSTELHDKRLDGETLTTAEQNEVAALQAAWDWVKSVRSASDQIEADLGTMTVDEMMADARWPAS